MKQNRLNLIKNAIATLTLLTAASSYAADAPFQQITYSWTEGALAGSQYQLILSYQSLHWHGLKGAEQGLSGTENQVEYRDLGNDRQLVSWLENGGYTVTLVVNSHNHQIDGVLSKEKEHHVISGKIESLTPASASQKTQRPLAQRQQTGRRPS